MIVSRLFAELMFPGESAVGKRVKSRDESAYREVIGVAEEVRYWGLAERRPAPLVYVPWAQDVPFAGSIVARSHGERAEAILPIMRAALLAIDPQMAIADLRTLEASAARSIVTERYSTVLLSGSGGPGADAVRAGRLRRDEPRLRDASPRDGYSGRAGILAEPSLSARFRTRVPLDGARTAARCRHRGARRTVARITAVQHQPGGFDGMEHDGWCRASCRR